MRTSAPSLRMPVFGGVLRCAGLVLLLLLQFAEPVHAGSRKALKLYEQGRRAELAGQYDEALELYRIASQEAPADNRYGLAERRMRFVAGQAHVDQAFKLRQQGLYQEALGEFERAITIDPASSVAVQERSRTLALIAKRDQIGVDDQGRPAAALDSALEADRIDRARRVGSMVTPAELVPLSNEPFNLMLTEDSKVVFETIAKLAGINVLFDPDFPEKEVEIEIRNVTLNEALDYVSLVTQAFWQPITHNTVLITSDNPNKRREFEDEVVKTVYLTNLSTPQDLSEVSTAIRGMTDIRRMFTVNSMSAIVMRGTRSKIALAEKIVHDMDKPRPEVIIDVLVLETSKTNSRTLGLTPLSGSSGGLQFPLSFTGAGAAAEGAGALTVAKVADVGSWSTSLPNFLITALFSKSETNLLQSPRVRAADNQQADLRIGDRIPIATGSFQPGVGGVGINPLVNTQFTYTDVGVNVALTPKIHANREVSMHVEIEISNVKEFVDIGGISQPVIGQRTIAHDVRVPEGEASIIGGLNQSQVFKTRAGVPFLGELPVIGKFFSDEEVRRTDSEILLVLVPHIVRMPSIEDTNLRTIASGTDQKFQLRYEEVGNGRPVLPAMDPAASEAPVAPAVSTPAPSEPVQPAVAEPTAEQPVSQAEAPGPPESPEIAPPTTSPTAEATAPSAGAAPQPPAGPRLQIDPAVVQLQVGQEMTLSLVVTDAVELVSMPLRVQYDPQKMRLLRVEKGPFLAGADASDIIFSRAIRHANGLAAVTLSRYPGAGGANGGGQLATLTFEGLEPGEAQLRVVATGPRNTSNASLQVQPLEVDVKVE